MMKGSKSTYSFYDFGVCWLCFAYFIEHREDKWREGRRPTKEAIDAMLAEVEGRQ